MLQRHDYIQWLLRQLPYTGDENQAHGFDSQGMQGQMHKPKPCALLLCQIKTFDIMFFIYINCSKTSFHLDICHIKLTLCSLTCGSSELHLFFVRNLGIFCLVYLSKVTHRQGTSQITRIWLQSTCNLISSKNKKQAWYYFEVWEHYEGKVRWSSMTALSFMDRSRIRLFYFTAKNI